MTHFLEVSIDAITVPADRIRDLDRDWAEVLAADIGERGLRQAIEVKPDGDGYRLIFGLHRLVAHRLLGAETIRAAISDEDETKARLSEIMENMIRNPLTALARAKSLYELDRLYKALFPDLKNGGNAQVTGEKDRSAVFALRSDILEKVGLSRRSFFAGIAIWKGLSPASRAAVIGTWMADHQAQLQALSSLKAKLQAEVLAILFPEGEAKPKATTVADALELIRHGRLPGATEKKFASLNRQISALNEEGLTAVFTAHEERLITWLKARGRI